MEVFLVSRCYTYGMKRCTWANEHPELIEYHDTEWGTPQHDDRKLFEWLCYNVFQAGLGWIMMLMKCEQFAAALDNYDIDEIAAYGPAELERLMGDKRVIRNRQKLQAIINNARIFRDIQEELGSFDAYVWRFTGGHTLRA
jgi:DNA-3-methyladenine glycosylase I